MIVPSKVRRSLVKLTRSLQARLEGRAGLEGQSLAPSLSLSAGADIDVMVGKSFWNFQTALSKTSESFCILFTKPDRIYKWACTL